MGKNGPDRRLSCTVVGEVVLKWDYFLMLVVMECGLRLQDS